MYMYMYMYIHTNEKEKPRVVYLEDYPSQGSPWCTIYMGMHVSMSPRYPPIFRNKKILFE